MTRTSAFHLRWIFVISLLSIPGAVAQAQAQSAGQAVACKDPTDPDIVFQSELCAAHAGCALVVKINKTCAAVQRFYDKLAESVGFGVKTLFGYRKKVEDQNVWDAVQTDNSRRLDSVATARAKSDEVLAGLKGAPTDVMKETGADGVERVYVGNVADGKLKGYGVRYGSDGEITRGVWSMNHLSGAADSLSVAASGEVTRRVGVFADDRFVNGTMVQADGQRVEGNFNPKTGQLSEGSKFGVDGSLLEQGTFRNGQLYIGDKYANDKVVASVNGPREEMRKAEAEQAANLERLQRAQEAAAAAEEASRRARQAEEQQFRDALGAMNPGQLYALADELTAGGDARKAREVLRTLVARFPDHALTAEAVKQMSALGAADAAARAATAKSTMQAKSSADAPQGCESSYRSLSAELKEMNAPPATGSVAALQRVIYATTKSLALGNGTCQGSAHEAELTTGMQAALDSATTACKQIAANASLCSARPSLSSLQAEAAQSQQRDEAARQQAQADAKAQRERAEMQDALNQLSDAIGKAVKARSGGATSDNTCGNGRPKPVGGVCTAR